MLHELGAVEAWGEARGSVLEQQCVGDVLRQVKPVGLFAAGGDFTPALDAARLILQDGFLEHTWGMYDKERITITMLSISQNNLL